MARRVVLALLGGLGGSLWAEAPPTVRGAPASTPIRVDGRLDEAAWLGAPEIRLTQQAPVPGAPTPFATTAKVLVAAEGLYVGIRCADPDPSGIVAHTLQRDGDFSGDDAVTLVVDTLGDGHTAYSFQVNASGARADGLVSGPESVSLDWDGLWEAATARDGSGWSLEIFIPSRTLRFDPARDRWGFNVERQVARERLTLRWASPILDAKLPDMGRAGTLEGVAGLKRGSGLSVSPFLLAQRQADFQEGTHSARGRMGLDVEASLTNQLSGMLTYRPDFAETEVDSRQINLTRFPLYFPEKRAFFLEGANQFQFGLGLDSDFIPFFSRTVGLAAGEPVPLSGGGKVIGRVGPVSVGALRIRQEGSAVRGGTDLSAARVSWDVDEHLRLGAIGTQGNPQGPGSNRLAGLDAVWQTSRLFGDKLFEVGLWTARSAGTALPEGDPEGWGFKVDYPNDLWDISLKVNRFGEALDPGMGFLPRPGTRQLSAGLAYQPRPASPSLAWIRQAFYEVSLFRVEGLRGNLQSSELFTAPFNVVTASGDHFEANWQPQVEVLAQPFEISPGVVIPAGEYRFNRWRLLAESAATRLWQAGTTVWFGEFYGGRLFQWIQSVGGNARDGHIRWTASAENDFARLPWGNFTQRLLQLRGEYGWAPGLILSGLLQYDTASRSLGSNLRLRWEVRPQAEAFLVWTRGWERPDLNGPLRFLPRQEVLSAKLRWTFRP
ncbi:carbohydrate binding family 9 domain-containing protein [Geothrix paludis]|uniref:carbohydrate binding family 9 domain-containing protein n=1 Tax=Geothrix paludis TaxID=2922722 RepID=UPI001FAC4F6F|nr:DUF5916 domain-containing protein [Geothrix paludis]